MTQIYLRISAFRFTRNPRLSSGNQGASALPSSPNPWAPGLCPPWIPQSLASSWLSPTHSGRLFSSHLQKRKQSTQKKTTKSWIQSEKKTKKRGARSSDIPFIHLATGKILMNHEMFFYDFKCQNLLSESPPKNGWKVPARRHGEDCKKFVNVNRRVSHPPRNPSQNNIVLSLFFAQYELGR